MTRFSRRQFVRALGGAGLSLALSRAFGLHIQLAAAHPALKTVDDMILIPGGPFVMGLDEREAKRLARRYHVHPSWLSSAVPRREVHLPSFHIDKYPVTNAQYFRYVVETGADWIYGPGNPPPQEAGSYPAAWVSFQDAADYAAWVGKRLPTEEEWEKAARGQRGFLFPWGNTWDPARCFCTRSRAAAPAGPGPVHAHPNGSSPYGVMDMVGNCCEWTASAYGPESNVVKGGFFAQNAPFLFLCCYRGMSQLRGNRQDYIGFRCVKDVEEESV